MRSLIDEIVIAANVQHENEVNADLKKLEDADKECGVTFRVWEKRNANGKWTSLQGNDTKKLLERLPRSLVSS